MIISGAANDSDPHRVVSIGEDEEMNRDRPKSVSFNRGVGRWSRGIEPDSVGGRENGLTVKMISGRVQLSAIVPS
jgi:hypothetical protein